MTTGAPTPTRLPRPRRSRLRTFLPLGVAVWLVLEIWLLVMVARATSGFLVFLLLVGGIVLGSVVIKRAGRRAFRNLSQTLQQQQSGVAPTTEGGGGNGMMMLGGLLLMIPGLISDAFGLLLLIPPVQKLLSRYAQRALDRTMGAAQAGTVGDAFQQARMHRADGKVVQGEVIHHDEPREPGEQYPPLNR
ncbi:FxsA family membrane protein [Streptomyces sp. NPDC058305]|uniref:FxsA family membrane protein n=1 Tax=Streptomyces sp. NPDC058305 TaxID=3346438 RepID=UPI0036EE7833